LLKKIDEKLVVFHGKAHSDKKKTGIFFSSMQDEKNTKMHIVIIYLIFFIKPR